MTPSGPLSPLGWAKSPSLRLFLKPSLSIKRILNDAKFYILYMIEVSNENRHFIKMAEDKLDKASSQAVGAIQNFTSPVPISNFS